MEVGDALRRRRMCRDFLGDPLAPALVEQVLDAANAAPSAGNTAALALLVLNGPDEVGRYWDVTLPEGPRRAGFGWPGLLRAPVLVLPYVEPDAYARRYAEDDKAGTGLGAGTEAWPVPYWWIDGGAAVMAMLVSATDLGLGALFFGQFHHQAAVSGSFGVPDGWRSLGTLALGHPAGDHAPGRSAGRGRRRAPQVVHRGAW